jgi:hypothetical protein
MDAARDDDALIQLCRGHPTTRQSGCGSREQRAVRRPQQVSHPETALPCMSGCSEQAELAFRRSELPGGAPFRAIGTTPLRGFSHEAALEIRGQDGLIDVQGYESSYVPPSPYDHAE